MKHAPPEVIIIGELFVDEVLSGFHSLPSSGRLAKTTAEAARQIKSSPRTAHIPIIAFTAHTLSEDVRRAAESGIDAYETKPVIYQRLMKKIEELMGH